MVSTLSLGFLNFGETRKIPSVKNGTVKLQHYVPQFYLKHFAQGDKVFVYDKVKDRSFSTNPKNIASETAFYDSRHVDQVMEQHQACEKWLSKWEGLAARFFASMFKYMEKEGGNFDLGEAARQLIAQHLAVQFIRTKEQRIRLKDLLSGIHSFFRSKYTEEEVTAYFAKDLPMDLTEEGLATLQSQMILSREVVKEYADVMKPHIWIILRAYPGCVFYTSDNPIAIQPHKQHPWRSMSGLGSPGVEVIFPLAPTFLLAMCERGHFLHLQEKNGKIMNCSSPENMIYYNHQQIKTSSRYLFSSTNEFDFARLVCKEEPHWADPRRARIENTFNNPDAVQQRIQRHLNART